MPKNRRRNQARPERAPKTGAAAAIDAQEPQPGSRRQSLGAARPAYIEQEGAITHVILPVDEYERLADAAMVQDAIRKLDRADETEWIDWDDLKLEFAAERIVAARKAKRLTQKQLGAKLGLPQSQISRIERNPDRTTVRTLKRIARALGVDVSALV
jgi:DNA-binding XRE family transcriptional regulator